MTLGALMLEFFRGVAEKIQEAKDDPRLKPHERKARISKLEAILAPTEVKHPLALIASYRPVPRISDDDKWNEWVHRVYSNKIPDDWRSPKLKAKLAMMKKTAAAE